MDKFFSSFRFTSLVAVVGSLLGSVLMFIIGSTKVYYAYAAYFLGYQPPTGLGELKGSDIATAYLIKSLDAFLIALVLFIFAYGVYWILVFQDTGETGSDPLKSVRINTISQLKKILAEVQSGAFAREFIADCENDSKELKQMRADIRSHPLEVIGRQLRGMMSWLKKNPKEATIGSPVAQD